MKIIISYINNNINNNCIFIYLILKYIKLELSFYYSFKFFLFNSIKNKSLNLLFIFINSFN